MKRLYAFRFALRPTNDQERTMLQVAGSCRYVTNRALALEIARHEAGEPRLGYVGVANLLPAWKRDPETVWLAGVHSQILQQSLKDLDRAYQNFFGKRAGFPKFRKKGENESFRYPQGVTLDEPNVRIFLPRIGWVRYRKSRTVLGTIKNVTVRRTGDKWFVSVCTSREALTPSNPVPGFGGIDLGVGRFATLSDGTAILAPDFSGLEKQLKHAQKTLSRKKIRKPESGKGPETGRKDPPKDRRPSHRLSAQDLDRDLQKPRGRRDRGSSCDKHEPERKGNARRARNKCPGQGRSQPVHSPPGVGRVPASARL